MPGRPIPPLGYEPSRQERPSPSPQAEAVDKVAACSDSAAGGESAPSVVLGAKNRLHHSYIWLTALRSLPVVIVVIASCVLPFVFAAVEVTGPVAAVAFGFIGLVVPTVLITAVIAGVSAVSYRFTWYQFDEREFTYCEGILSKRRAHVPYLKVQSVNETTSLLQRLVGVCSVVIETAGGADNKAVKVKCVERSAAEIIRRELFTRKRAEAALSQQVPVATAEGNLLDVPADIVSDMRGVFAAAEVDTGTVTYETRLTNKELLLAAVTGRSSFALALVAAISAIASVITAFIDTGFMAMPQVSSFISAGPLAVVVIALVVIAFLAVAWVVYLIASLLSYGGFTARRRGTRIEVEHGILTHVFSGIDVERIQSVIVHQTLFQRLLKSCSISYGRIAAATEAAENGGSSSSRVEDRLVVHPFLPLARVPEVVSSLTPEFASVPLPDRRVSPKARRRAVTRGAVFQGLGFWSAAVVTLALLFLGAFPLDGQEKGILFVVLVSLLVVALVVFVFEVIGALLWYRHAAFGYDAAAVTVVNGGYSVDTTTIPRVKIQRAFVRTNPLQRRVGTATLNAVSAAGVGGTRVRLIDVDAADAKAWLDWMLPRNRAFGDDGAAARGAGKDHGDA